MADEERIDSYVDRTGWANDTKFVLDHLNQVYDAFQKLNGIKLSLDKSTGMAQVIPLAKSAEEHFTRVGESAAKLVDIQTRQAAANRQVSGSYQELTQALAANQIEQKKLAAEAKKLQDGFQNGAVTNEEYVKQLAAIKGQQAQLSVSSAELTKGLKNIEREAQSADGSLNQMRAQLLLAQQAFDNMSRAEKESVQGKELVKKIEDITRAVKEEEQATGRFQRNVGNYANSLADGFERVRKEIETLRQKQEGLQRLQKADPIGFKLTAQSKELQQTTQAIAQLERVTKISENENISFSKSVRQIGFAFQDMEASGNFSREFLQEFKKFAAQAKDQADDLRQEIKALSSDTRKLDLVASGLTTIVNAGQAAFAAYELLGDGSEDVQKSIQRLVAVQQVANGVQQVAKDLTDKGSAAYAAYAAVQRIVKTVTDSNVAATLRWVAATKLLLGGLLIGGVALLVIKMIQLKNAVSDAVRQSKLLAEVNKEVAQSAGQEIAKLETLYRVATNTNLSIKERKKAVDELQAQYPLHFANLKDEEILQGKAAAAYDKTKLAILEQAKARAIESKLSELATSDLEIQLGRQDLLLKKQDAQRQARLNKQKTDANKSRGFGAGVTPEEFLAGEGAIDSINRQLEDGNKRLEQNQKDRDFLLNQLTQTATSGGGGGSNRLDTSRLERLKLLQEQIAEKNKEIFEDENKTFIQRLEALKEYTAAREEIIRLEREIELKQENLTNDQIDLINERATDKRKKLEKETEVSISKIRFDQRIRREEKAADEEYKVYDKLYKDLTDRYQKYLDEKEKKRKEDEEKEKEVRKNRKELEKQLVSDLTALSFTLLTASIEKQKNDLQQQADAIDERKAKEIELANQTIASEKDRAAAIAVIEARAQAQKEAIQRRQRDLDNKKARFDKAQAIARIVQETAIAVVASLTKPTLIPLIIGIGAAQLASVIAQPIPRYRQGAGVEGRPAHPGGKFIAGDGGKPELVVTPDGRSFITASTPTVYEAPRNTLVFPDVEAMTRNAAMRLNAGANQINHCQPIVDNSEVKGELTRIGDNIVRAIQKIPQPQIKVMNPLKHRIKYGDSTNEYLNRNLQG